MYRLQPYNIAKYNLDLVLDASSSSRRGWVVAGGLLTPSGEGSDFRARLFVDLDQANGVDEAFELHVEYQAPADTRISMSATSRGGFPIPLNPEVTSISASGLAADFSIAKGDQITNEFRVTW